MTALSVAEQRYPAVLSVIRDGRTVIEVVSAGGFLTTGFTLQVEIVRSLKPLVTFQPAGRHATGSLLRTVPERSPC